MSNEHGAHAASSTAPVPPLTRKLAAFAATLSYNDIPEEVIIKTDTCVIDALGCMLFGSTLPWTRIVVDVAREEGGEAQASVIGTGLRMSVPQAVLVNSTAGHGFELDDAHTRGSMHAGSIAIATALALAEWRTETTGRDLVTAIVAGYETGLRVGIGGAGGIFRRGFHSAAVCGVFVAAATAGRLLGLDAERMQHAFGIAGSLGAGLASAQEGAMVKRLHAGHAAKTGVTAALLARRGFTGIMNVVEAPFGGFLGSHSDHGDVAAVMEGLGESWETMAIGFKPYATAGSIHPALSLLQSIMRDDAITADEIEVIEVECTTHCRDHVAWPYVPQGVASAQMNMYYALSVMAIDGAAMVDQFGEQRLAAPRILDYMRHIRVAADAGFDAMGTAFRYATRLTVVTKDGVRRTMETLYRPGSPESPLSDEQVIDKFERLAAHVVGPEVRKKIRETVARMETLESVEPLVALLRVGKSEVG
jgi:2-methylcitrate dehydratase PrpD